MVRLVRSPQAVKQLKGEQNEAMETINLSGHLSRKHPACASETPTTLTRLMVWPARC